MSGVRRLDAGDPDHLAEAVDVLGRGLVVAVPTDTVYGLAADPGQPAAVARVFEVKERPAGVALPVLVGAWDQVGALAGELGAEARRLADRYWPGPLTLVVPRRTGFDADLGGPPAARGTVGVRWPDHPTMAALCAAAGPLAVTSANPHGLPPATTADEVVGGLGRRAGLLAAVVDGGTCDGTPSTVVECTGPLPRCLREGGVPWAELATLLA